MCLIAGGAPLQLTKDDIDHYGPRWTHDSSGLIYYTPGAQPERVGTLWEIPALAGLPRRLVTALASGDMSHDGKNLAFFRFRDGASELAVAARDQSTIRTVTKLPAGALSNLRWSPDDRRLVDIHEMGGSNFDTTVMVVAAAGGIRNPPRSVSPSRGPHGFRMGSGLIVSSSQGSQMPYPPTFNLWKIRLDGGAPVQLTFGETSYEFPDIGTQGNLVVSRVRAQSDVWRFPVTGPPAENARQGTRITRQTGLLQTASASPDDSEIAFLSDNGGHANVWIAKVSDGEMRPVTREFDPRVIVAVALVASGRLDQFSVEPEHPCCEQHVMAGAT